MRAPLDSGLHFFARPWLAGLHRAPVRCPFFEEVGGGVMKCQARRAHFSPMSLERRHRVGEVEVPLMNSPLHLGLLTSEEGPSPTLVLNAVLRCISTRHPPASRLDARGL